jgi:type IV pilus assembly protein PilM
MAWPSFSFRSKQRDEVVAVDLGGRHTKAVHIQNKSGRYNLIAYSIQDSPTEQASTSVDVLAEHLKSVFHSLGNRTRDTAIALGPNDTVIRRAEMPPMPVGDMRQLLKFNSKTYVQQELPDHVFDCSILLPRTAGGAVAEAPKQSGGSHKQKVLVGAAKRKLVEDVEAAVKQAGLAPSQIVPGLVGPLNAFEMAEPQVFANETVALVDLGFRNTTVCMVQQGELVMHRVVNIAGDRLTSGLAEAMNISYAEAEGIKVGMPAEVQATLEPLVTSLGRELRAFVDFFEHQQDVPVSQVFLSGGCARGEMIVQALQMELLVPCKVWNPSLWLTSLLGEQHGADFQLLAPQFAVAVGTAVSAL